MSAKRRPKGSLINAKPVGWRLQEPYRDRIHEIAAKSGVNEAVVVEWLIDSIKLDNFGRPLGWVDPITRNEELPIPAA